MPTPWPYPRWVAHRGAGKLAPENTLAAFRLGASHGYRMFECDVKLSADGVPFLMHDAELDRTTSGHGIGGEQTWQALAQLDAGSWHSRTYAGEPLPTLGNVARFCLRNAYFLNIEIKPTPGQDRDTGTAVAREAQRLWLGHAGAGAIAPGAALARSARRSEHRRLHLGLPWLAPGR
ncbi:MAG: glycerophosphodiester phosphodiesterase family protein, partial [Burkholderiaceae bacterium]|nr:glycerophosphodiester phosphodiesterase family protein [Burkholderiaceae bacterium]